MMDERRSYPIFITVNDRVIHKVVIDPHYEAKHKNSVDDSIILELVRMLDGGIFIPQAEDDGFQYFKADPLVLNGLCYRLIWLLENDEIYVGVINAFRR